MKLVILAGGKGSRLNLKRIPKPMVKIHGKPILEYQIELAKKYGIKEIYILSGHLAKVIVNYFFDGKKFGVNIRHLVEQTALGTAGCLRQLKKYVKKNERFIVLSGDILIDMNLKHLMNFDHKQTSLATIVVFQTDHPQDSDLLKIDKTDKIVPFSINRTNRAEIYKKLAVASLGIFSSEIIDYIPEGKPIDLWKEILPKMVRQEKQLFAYESSEYMEDMGTLKRLKEVRRDWKKNAKIGF